MRSLSAAFLFLLPPLPAQAVWVDATNGVDTNPGTAAQPVKSLTVGLLLATTNTTVFVRGGTYSVATTNEVFPLELGTNNSHDGVTLFGLDRAVVDLANAPGIAIRVGLLANRGRITNLEFRNMDKNDWWTQVVSAGSFNGAGSSSGVEIDRCRFVDVNRGIVLWQGRPITGWRIHNNLFRDLGNDAVNEFDRSSDNDVYNNTFFAGAHLGMLTDSDTTRVDNNILTGLRAGVASSASSTTTNGRMRSNCFWNNQRDVEGTAFAGGLPPSSLTVDPSFRNAAGGDLRLTATSPLLERGTPVAFPRADLDMVSGVVDYDADGRLLPDVGAYEATPMTLVANATAGTLSFNLSSNTSSIPIGLMLFGLDDGLIQLPGFSPILIAPAALIVPGFIGQLPFAASGSIPTLRPGVRIVLQGFGFEPSRGVLVAGNQVRLQF